MSATALRWIHSLATARAHVCKQQANVEGAPLQAMRGRTGAAENCAPQSEYAGAPTLRASCRGSEGQPLRA
eukprot:9406288-Pyramimonas_sp.AAC.1